MDGSGASGGSEKITGVTADNGVVGIRDGRMPAYSQCSPVGAAMNLFAIRVKVIFAVKVTRVFLFDAVGRCVCSV